MTTSISSEPGGILICPHFSGSFILVARDLLATRIEWEQRARWFSDYDTIFPETMATITAMCVGGFEIVTEGPKMMEDATVLELVYEVRKRLKVRSKSRG